MRLMICLVLVACMAFHPARAAMLPFDEPGDGRHRLLALLARPEAREALEARGVSPQEARARVMALTDEEALELAAEIDRLAAGGRGDLELVAFVVLIWYVLDRYGALILLVTLMLIAFSAAKAPPENGDVP